ncbi:uncharacterized protein LY89DRAFT_729993 [Mollisia scopiformis]|uniref:Uncharacterized protein n=1 Tax=Mollisia scopiformis TaxID=149040 RepID=A0A194XM35_MOLSC|nr:uncharacterized protein LY89DRAFT_729993 [Mollisia scopiformis]KUJ21201.1 hypothetical protein LY89DRAFT_729993 [Mollisia scopiformis]
MDTKASQSKKCSRNFYHFSCGHRGLRQELPSYTHSSTCGKWDPDHTCENIMLGLNVAKVEMECKHCAPEPPAVAEPAATAATVKSITTAAGIERLKEIRANYENNEILRKVRHQELEKQEKAEFEKCAERKEIETLRQLRRQEREKKEKAKEEALAEEIEKLKAKTVRQKAYIAACKASLAEREASLAEFQRKYKAEANGLEKEAEAEARRVEDLRLEEQKLATEMVEMEMEDQELKDWVLL